MLAQALEHELDSISLVCSKSSIDLGRHSPRQIARLGEEQRANIVFNVRHDDKVHQNSC